MLRPAKSRHPHRGFTLIEIVVVMLIFSVIIAMSAVITRGAVSAQKRSLTATRMAGIEAALVQYVIQRKRLPCPADGTKLSSANDAGTEMARTNTDGCTTQTNGVVPWRELGLTETDATDGWDRRLTYRVHPLLAANLGMDMSWCDPTGNAGLVASPGNVTGGVCSQACVATNPATCTAPSTYLANKGLDVRAFDGVTVLMNPAGVPHTGAAYVMISPGESGGGAYLSGGVLANSNTTDSTQEQRNYADRAYVAGATYYVDAPINDTAGETHFDDILVRPSVIAVAMKGGLGPRTH